MEIRTGTRSKVRRGNSSIIGIDVTVSPVLPEVAREEE